MEFYYPDMAFQDNFDAIREAQRSDQNGWPGDPAHCQVRCTRDALPDDGPERFAIDYHERRDLFDSLHITMVKRYEELYEFAAKSPVEILQLGDNIYSGMVGRERVSQYLHARVRELKERLSGTGKLLAVHMDWNLRSLCNEIRRGTI